MSPLRTALDSPALRLIQREAAGAELEFLLLAIGSGGANALLLALINNSTSVETSDGSARALIFFGIALAIMVICMTRLFHRSSQVFENAVERIRLRLIDKIYRADLRSIENIGESSIYSRLTVDTTSVSQAQALLTTAFQSAVMVLFIVGYIAFLSLPLFAVSIVMVLGGYWIHSHGQAETLAAYETASATRVKFIGLITSLLSGFKEVKVNDARAKDLVTDLAETSSRMRELMLQTFQVFHGGYVMAQAFFYSLLAVLVFVIPRIADMAGDTVTDLTATVLFLIGPLSAVVSALPGLEKTNAAITDIYALERRLDESITSRGDRERGDVVAMPVPDVIELRDIQFCYRDANDQPLFAVGPLSFQIRRGEITFILGGNGSGKSTCLKLLTGLYSPDHGEVWADRVPIDATNIAEYQALFSVIFSDFQLFQTLYGMRDTEPARVQAMLDKLGIGGKTRYVPPRFSHIELSTGQRKRIALTVALLEDRPIALFDEVAADQDVEFREYFYRVLLPELRAAGKTVIVVSHDDRYYDVADQLVKLEVGRIHELIVQAERGTAEPSTGAAAPSGGRTQVDDTQA